MLYLLLLLGIGFIILGFIYRKKGKLSWINENNREHIKPEDEKRLMKEIGFACIWMGCGFLLDAFLISYLSKLTVGLIMMAFILSGIGLIIHTFRHYNRP